MTEPAFDYLSGTVTIPAAAPESWKEDGLDAFYEGPNNPAWGAELCRTLYHESLHFWQFLAWGYVANLVGEEWERLQRFEATGEVVPPTGARAHRARGDGPFSADNLLECSARYWDVHTRNPAQIVREEGIDPDRPDLEVTLPGTEDPVYTGAAFDLVMQRGPYCARYAAPYRWMLTRAEGDSWFVAVTFPILVNMAFGSLRPVEVFRDAFERAVSSGPLRDHVRAQIERVRRNVNLGWLACWEQVLLQAGHPALEAQGLTVVSGVEVIANARLADVLEYGHAASLSNHPIFRECPLAAGLLAASARASQLAFPDPGDPVSLADYEVARAVKSAPELLAFALPGQPVCRGLLGHFLPPPRVRFANYAWAARRTAAIRASEVMTRDPRLEETYEMQLADLEPRVRGFRAAEQAAETAAKYGLPPDAFGP